MKEKWQGMGRKSGPYEQVKKAGRSAITGSRSTRFRILYPRRGVKRELGVITSTVMAGRPALLPNLLTASQRRGPAKALGRRCLAGT